MTISNEGSILDADTLPTEVLLSIARCVRELRLVRRLVLETRLEFVDSDVLRTVRELVPNVVLDILTGFETRDESIRNQVLVKREPLDLFLRGLDRVAEAGCELTSYVLYKPAPTMTDADALTEAERTIDYLSEQCSRRDVRLTIRLNPMYAAAGSKWAERARSLQEYRPPRLADIMKLAAKKRKEGLRLYVGLSAEGLDESWGNYMVREDYTPSLIRPIKLFNDLKISSFEEPT